MHIIFRSEMLDQTRDSTVSSLYLDVVDGGGCDDMSYFIGVVIEDGFRKDKIYGESRVSSGLRRLKKKTSGRFFDKYKTKYDHPFVLEFVGVLNFTAILAHMGNTIKDTLGCLLVNTGFSKDDNGNYKGIGSEKAYKRMFEILKAYNYPDEMYWRIIR